MKNITPEFPRRLHQALDAHGVTRHPASRKRFVAKFSGVSERQAENYFNGSRYPRLDKLIALACAIQISLDWLLTGRGDMRDFDKDAGAVEEPRKLVAVEPKCFDGAVRALQWGQRLKQARYEAGLSQLDIARRGGVTRGLIPQWENGAVANPNTQSFLLICDALSVDPFFILFGVGGICRADRIISRLNPHDQAQALRMLEAFARSCLTEATLDENSHERAF